METKLYARQCSITGNGMNEGWVIRDGEFYIANEEDCKRWLLDNFNMTLEEAHENEELYWTEWEDIRDYQYIQIDGKLYEISKFFNL